jgi:hypothetical protein
VAGFIPVRSFSSRIPYRASRKESQNAEGETVFQLLNFRFAAFHGVVLNNVAVVKVEL